MKQIKNYNPDLGLTLNDFSVLLVLEEADEFCGSLMEDVIEAIYNSVKADTSYTFPYRPKQIAYDTLMEKVSANVEEYEKQLIEQGYTQDDIDEYHKRMYDKLHNEKDERNEH